MGLDSHWPEDESDVTRQAAAGMQEVCGGGRSSGRTVTEGFLGGV